MNLSRRAAPPEESQRRDGHSSIRPSGPQGTIKEGVGRDVTIAMTALHVLGIVVLDREANSAATPRTST